MTNSCRKRLLLTPIILSPFVFVTSEPAVEAFPAFSAHKVPAAALITGVIVHLYIGQCWLRHSEVFFKIVMVFQNTPVSFFDSFNLK